MTEVILPVAGEDFETGARALHLETIINGGGRKRLRSAYPVRVERGRWQVERTGTWRRLTEFPLPDAIQMPSGAVHELGSGLLFNSRLEFLRARGAVAA